MLIENPSPEAILAFKASPEDEELLSDILARNKAGRKTEEDESLMNYYQKIEGTIVNAKVKAMVMLKDRQP